MAVTTTTSYLTTSDLTVGYRTYQVENRLFENLNLTLDSGQLICFMGPNGSGKSSLIRTIAGLQKPLSGKIITQNLTESADIPKLLSVVLTEKVTSINMTAYEVVTYGRYPYMDWTIKLSPEDNNIIDRSIHQVRIKDFIHKKLYELSDGQVQMVMIARALAQDTPIILLDEPTAHLDLNNRVEIMRLLQNLSRLTNKAILVATHELDLALQTADKIWLTGKEKNILTGIPEDLILNGSFDEIFRFKGFDLKSGKILHEYHRKIKIQLIGKDHEFLWTKNALERNGFEVTDEPSNVTITIDRGNNIKWLVRKDEVELVANSVAELMEII